MGGASIGMDASLEADDFILCPLCKTAVDAAPESACEAANKIASVDMDKCESFVSSSAGGDVGEEVCSFVGICQAQGNSVSVPSTGGVGTSIGMDTSLEADDFIL